VSIGHRHRSRGSAGYLLTTRARIESNQHCIDSPISQQSSAAGLASSMPTRKRPAAAPWRAANAIACSHVLRWALHCLSAAINGLELGSHCGYREQEVELEFATTIEVWAGTRSTFTRESYELGNAAVRIVAPSAHLKARPGGAPWKLALGRVYTWPLDLQNPAHFKKLLEYIRQVEPARGSKSMHLHTSPPCGTFSKVQRIVRGRGGKPRTPRPIALQRLDSARRLHRAWSRRAFPGRSSRSHEQSEGCTTHPRWRKRGPEDFPWALGPKSSRVNGYGCAAGLVDSESDLAIRKPWTFESDHEPLLATLRLFSGCSGGHEHCMTLSEAGRRGCGTRITEAYPTTLGALLATAVSCG
jgi:hypothetical protein